MEDTEWNDILRSKGIIEAEVTESQVDQIMDEVIANRNPLDELDLDELDDLAADDRFIEDYRLKRIQEMEEFASKAKYGTIEPISRAEYASKVTEASGNQNPEVVIVFMYDDSVEASRLAEQILEKVAKSWPCIKFVKIIASQCIENYPLESVPTLLVYGSGELKDKLVGINKLGGMDTDQSILSTIIKRSL